MQHKGYGKLYLIPNFLSVENPNNFLADYVRDSVKHIKKFIVESDATIVAPLIFAWILKQ